MAGVYSPPISPWEGEGKKIVNSKENVILTKNFKLWGKSPPKKKTSLDKSLTIQYLINLSYENATDRMQIAHTLD